MTKFTWYTDLNKIQHTCYDYNRMVKVCINTADKAVTYYKGDSTPLFTQMYDVGSDIELLKEECEEYLSRIHLDFNLKDIGMNENYIKCEYPLVGKTGGLFEKPAQEEIIEQFQNKIKAEQINQDMDFINKVAIEAMKEALKTLSMKQGEPQDMIFKGVSTYCYSLGKAMLEQSKKVRAELINKDTQND